MPASEVELTPSPVHRRNPKSSSFSRNNNIESHQYEEYENEVWKHHQAQYKFSTQTHWWSTINKRQCRMWTQTLVIGILTGISAYFVIYCTGRLTAIKLSILYRYIDLERDGEIAFGNAFGIYALFNCLCVSIAWFTVYMAPNAAGSGIPEVKSFLNGLSVPFLGMNTILWKLFGIVFTVSGGLPAGKEGPMIHAGSGWALAVCESDSLLKRVGLNTSFRKFHDFHNDGEKRDYVTTGAAAGVAAAFGAPVGGVLFSLEEGASFFSKTLVWRSFFCAMVAVTTLFVIRTVNIHLGQAHANAMFSFGEFFRLNASVYNFSVWELPLFCLQGFMGGLIGAAFNEANKRLRKFRMSHYIGNMGVRWIEVLCVSLVMSIVSFGIPTLFPYCTPKPSNMEDWTDQEKDLSNRLVPLYCDPEKEYSQTGSLYLTDSDTAIKQLFHFREIGDDAEPTFSSGSLVLFFLPYICLACLNYGTAVPSGLFVPSLLQGACFGRLVGHLLHAFDRRRGTFADSGTFALVGAAAGLGGMARMTISLVVILLEATGDIQYLVPLMLTVMLARWVGNCFNDGLYDIHIHLKNIPLLEENDPDNAMVDISVADVMTSAPVCIPPLVSVCEVFALLQRNRHHCFPVIGKSHLHENSKRDDGGPDILLGVVPRKAICVLLQHRAFGFFDKRPNTMSEFPLSPLVNWGALERQYPDYPDVDDITLTSSDMCVSSFTTLLERSCRHYSPCNKQCQGWIDLRPYMDPGPFTLNEKASVQRTYKLFRTLGLRHILITNTANQVVGIVTRKDLLPGHIAKFDRFQNSSVECIDGSEAPLTSYERRKSGAKGNITLDGLNC